MLALQITIQTALWRARDRVRVRDWSADDGMTTETVIITAILAALALAVGAVIVFKVTNKASSIPVDGTAGG
jgi:hypothetical protein